MAGPELTPEMLAQLEKDAAGFSATTFRWMVDADRGDGERGNALVADDGRWLIEIGPDLDAHVAEPIARLLSAAPALVAAAQERDQLRAEVERLRGQQVTSPARDFDPFGPADQLPADVLADVETERGLRPIERKP